MFIKKLMKNLSEMFERQTLLIGKKAQRSLQKKTVAIIGLGGLGSPIAMYLARLGLKKLILIERDKVELSNLARQMLYDRKDLGKSKLDAAYDKLNSFVAIEKSKLISETLLRKADLIVSCVDNWQTRYLVNDICVANRIPLIDIAVEGFHGHITWVFDKHACLQCLYKKTDKKRIIPIINSSCLLVSAIALNEAVKFLVGKNIEKDKIIFVDGLNTTITKIKTKQNKNCRCNRK